MSCRWQEALWEEGIEVMYEVTVQLYPGNIPPRNILKNDYNKFFDLSQRAILDSWEENGFFEISSLAKQFDISLHFAVQKHVCNIWKHKSLFENVKNLNDMRNKAAHSVNLFQPTSNDENEELDEVLQLCLDILEDLEECTGSFQTMKKRKIQSSIERKKIFCESNGISSEALFFLNTSATQQRLWTSVHAKTKTYLLP